MWPEVEKAKNENRRELSLWGNKVSERIGKGGLDLSVFDLTNLNFFDIHDTCLKTVPEQIINLKNLQTLILHSNQLDAISPHICQLDKLKLLDLSKNNIKEIPAEINKLVNIITLNVSFNQIEIFPELTKTPKLTLVDLSNNKLTEFPNLCHEELTNLAELKLTENHIVTIPPEICKLPALKLLELSRNRIKDIPGELADCHKLKTINLKENPISNRRLLKLINQCHTKQILDFIDQIPRISSIKDDTKENLADDNKSCESESSNEGSSKYKIRVKYANDTVKIVIDDSVKNVREFFIACLVCNVRFTEATFKKFIQIQNKLHETICNKRNSSTIATHDFRKLPPGELVYTTMLPKELRITPLNRTSPLTGAQLFSRLQIEAHNLRKEKKRNSYSGIHKYLYLIEGQSRYPCLRNADGIVISFPPITNSEVTKIDVDTKQMLLEVTSSVSLHLCKEAMAMLLKELVLLMEQDLEIIQIKTTDKDGNLKVAYPSKTDLNFTNNTDIKVLREN